MVDSFIFYIKKDAIINIRPINHIERRLPDIRAAACNTVGNLRKFIAVKIKLTGNKTTPTTNINIANPLIFKVFQKIGLIV